MSKNKASPEKPANTQPKKASPGIRSRRKAPRLVVQSFLNGLLVLTPVAATLWILWRIFLLVDELLPLPDTVAPGIGFLLVLLLVTVIGALTSNFISAQVLALSDRIFARLPFVKLVYTSIKDLTEAFVGQKKKFDRPVLLTVGTDIEVIGFVTREDLSEFGASDRIAVYVPQSYNFAANLLIVPKERVRVIDKPSSEVMAFVVSGGLTAGGAE